MRKVSKLLCLILCVFLLTACGKQVAEDPTDPQGTTQVTQPQTQPTYPLGQGELPPVVIPPQTQPVTEPTEPSAVTEPVEDSTPTQPETTQPPETEPAETTEPSELDENELPPIVVG